MRKVDLIRAPIGSYWILKAPKRHEWGKYTKYTFGVVVKVGKTKYRLKKSKNADYAPPYERVYGISEISSYGSLNYYYLYLPETKGLKSRRNLYESVCKQYKIFVEPIPIKRVLRMVVV